MSRRIANLAAFGVLVAVAGAQKIVDLTGDGWTLTNPALNISVPAKVPSQAHLDLYASQVIGDPYFGLNDFNLRWVAENNWTYTSEPIAGLNKDAASTWLLFQGLDTFTSIEFCGKHVASTNNQFRQYYFEVSSILKECSGSPELSINFGSAPNIVDQMAAEPNQETWPEGVQLNYEFQNRWFMRKEQSDFGWDWGPAFAPAGPWLPAYVIQLASSQVYVRNALVDIYRQGQKNNLPPDQSQPWVVNASLDYLGTLSDNPGLSYKILDPANGNATVASGKLQDVKVVNGAVSGNVVLPKSTKVNLWWPNGLGQQNLYYVEITVTGSSGKAITSATRRAGFRTIVLNEGAVTKEQEAMGIAPGNNWHFEINGHPFFAKGSNFIPPDAFWPRVTPTRIQQLFDSVVNGNQNMLRVWASGAYSPDFIYDLADEMGILLWSEFEFGDSLYPVAQEFLDNVYEEVNYQVRRVNHHPSLAFWAGGNELENLELSLVNSSAPNEYVRYKNEYEKLFLSTIFPAVFDNTHSISYAPSSTSNGYISLNFTDAPYFQERYETLVPGSVYGETDYYDYDPTIAFNFSSYPVGRFSNEFGYHSMPSLQSWQQAVAPEYLTDFNSSVVMLRNHHYPSTDLNTTNYYNSSLGMGEMTRAAIEWYPVPDKADPTTNFSAWCHTTQLFQADFYTSQISFYRRGSGLRQRTLGSLYWQLEDIWQAPTWASIEYDGRWKALHYAAKRTYDNVIVSPFYNDTTGQLDIYITSDLWQSVSGTVQAQWYDWSGNALSSVQGIASGTKFTVGALNTTMVYSRDINTTLATAKQPMTNAVLRMSVSATGYTPNNATEQTFTNTNWFSAAALSRAKLVDPGLTLALDSSAQTFTVTATRGVAAHVWLDYPAGTVLSFDDNGFWLAKGESRTVGWTLKSDTSDGKWVNGVTIQSLWNNTLPN